MVAPKDTTHDDSKETFKLAAKLCWDKAMVCSEVAEEADACHCDFCRVNSTLQGAVSAVMIGGYNAFRGRPEILNEIATFLNQLREKYGKEGQ